MGAPRVDPHDISPLSGKNRSRMRARRMPSSSPRTSGSSDSASKVTPPSRSAWVRTSLSFMSPVRRRLQGPLRPPAWDAWSGTRRTGDEVSLPPSAAVHVARPIARKRVSSPRSSKLLLALLTISASAAVVCVFRLLSTRSVSRTPSLPVRPDWSNDFMASASAPERSSVPTLRSLWYRRLLRRDMSTSWRIHVCRAALTFARRSGETVRCSGGIKDDSKQATPAAAFSFGSGALKSVGKTSAEGLKVH